MQRVLSCAALALGLSLALEAQPLVDEGGILNAASYLSPRLPGGAIAQGSIFVIFGDRMGPATLAAAGFPLPNTLAGTSVRVTSGGQSLDCPLVYTVASQVAAILPSNTPVGSATLTVSFGGQTSAARSFRVVASAFGTFSLNLGGTGPGVITNFESATSHPLNTALQSARPGQTLILYGTGLGALPAGTPDNGAAPAVQINAANVELYVGSRRANVAYAGRAPTFAGLDQINFVVPGGVEGCSVPVAVKIGDIISNYVSIAVAAAGGVCSDPLSLPSSLLDRLNSGGSVRLGNMSLSRVELENSVPVAGIQALKIDSGNADFSELTPAALNSGAQLGLAGSSSMGTCYVFVGNPSGLFPADPIRPRGLDAGTAINLNGPKGARTLRRAPGVTGSYNETLTTGDLLGPILGGGDPDGYLVAGNYTFNNGTGGTDVRGFNTSYTLPPNLNWTNRAATTTVNRANGLTVNWTGGDPNGYVQIYGFSPVDNNDNSVRGYFVCTERTSVGTFTVPPAVLLAIPPSPPAPTGSSLPPRGSLGVGSISPTREFSAPGIDYGTLSSTSMVIKPVPYQ
ncbi:MAG: hypothetical protein K7J46_03095 [Bryobacter sp.]|jgi:uncharacterized protein (TIGR03437 family)|nr:hypothetical protein [Bryobacter sp. CoA8 C33]